MKKRKVFLAVAGILAILGIARYKILNARYPDPTVHIAEAGEEISFDNYSFKLKDWKWSDGTIVDEILPGYELLVYSDGKVYPAEKEKIALATVEIGKNADDDSHLDLRSISFEMGAWHNQWDLELFEALNGDDSLEINLNAGKKREIILPIIMYDFQFTEKEWENIEKKKVNIVLSCYPDKYVLQGGL